MLLGERAINATIDRDGIKIKLNQPLNLKTDEIEIIAHPNMNENNFKFNREKFAEIGFDLKASRILTKEAIDELLI